MSTEQTATGRAYLTRVHAADQSLHAWRGEEVTAWQTQARPALAATLGLERLAHDNAGFTPVVQLQDTAPIAGCRSQHGLIETEPGIRLALRLLLPAGAGPFPVALVLHGHDPFGVDTAVGIDGGRPSHRQLIAHGYDLAVQAVARGYAAVAVATRGIADGFFHDTTQMASSHCRAHNLAAIAAGRCAIGERVWDVQRTLDWTLAQSWADPACVLTAGNSGGGVLTQFVAALDERVTLAIPSCSYTAFFSADGGIQVCYCNLVPGIRRFGEAWDVCGLIAPRPLLVVHGDADEARTGPRVERDFARLRAIYAAAGADARVTHRCGAGGHRLYPELMWPWVERWATR